MCQAQVKHMFKLLMFKLLMFKLTQFCIVAIEGEQSMAMKLLYQEHCYQKFLCLAMKGRDWATGLVGPGREFSLLAHQGSLNFNPVA